MKKSFLLQETKIRDIFLSLMVLSPLSSGCAIMQMGRGPVGIPTGLSYQAKKLFCYPAYVRGHISTYTGYRNNYVSTIYIALQLFYFYEFCRI